MVNPVGIPSATNEVIRPQDVVGERAGRPARENPPERESAVGRPQLEEAPQQASDAAKLLEDKINTFAPEIFGQSSRLSIEADEATGHFVYKKVDKQTGEVLSQWPEEDLMRMLEFLNEAEGLVVNREA